MTDDATPLVFDPVPALAFALSLPRAGVAAVVALLDEGNTVPFIARYRKERTGGLDEVQIRAIEDKRAYLVELEERRAAILASVAEQGKLSPELEHKLRAALTKSELEDLYAPFRPRRKTRASVARDKGLQPLADQILAQGDAAVDAATFVTEQVPTADDALAGARDIVAEQLADTAEIRVFVRREAAEHGELVSEVLPGKDAEPTKFEQYYKHREPVKAIPSHRYLAIRRGEAEGVLRAHVATDPAKVEAGIVRLAKLVDASPWAEQLRLAISDALKRLLAPAVENDLRAELKTRSDVAATDIFAGNLRNLLLAAPLGTASVIGVDPGVRTGCKCAAIDATGKFLGTVTVFVSQGDAQLAKAKADFTAFVQQHAPRAPASPDEAIERSRTAPPRAPASPDEAIERSRTAPPRAPASPDEAIERSRTAPPFAPASPDEAIERSRTAPPFAIAVGNGTGGREAEAFVKRALADAQIKDVYVVQVNEAGASVYSASDLAREEFPELDLTIRGAISIARRLQDPLAELVKIEPKSIGVGQYQHDVQEKLLAKRLGDVVESCVNHVGVELNTASAQLLGYVAGIGKSLAKKIVVHRDEHGAFRSRAQLADVPGLGPKAFEQAAGFLRIHGAAHPLDASAVHPERYALVEHMAVDLGVELPAVIGNAELVDKIDLARYVAEDVGEPTLRDIAAELKKPGRDPRAEFAPPKFRDDVTTMEDLKPGMVLEGIVTNVTAFGAFVDIGVHNDGLVHVSQLAEQFVKEPSAVVKVGQKLKVRVLEIDHARKRIALSARPPQPKRESRESREPRDGQPPRDGGPRDGGERPNRGRGQRPPQGQSPVQGQGDNGNRRGPQQQGGGERRRYEQRFEGQRGDGPREGQRGDAPREGQRGDGPREGQRGDAPREGQRGDAPREGQRGDGQRGDAPRGDRGPRRDERGDRGPRRDERRDDRQQGSPPPTNWGVSGFTNNPFAKLSDKERKS